MEDKKGQENTENPKGTPEDVKNIINEAEEFAKEAKESAENFAEKTLKGASKFLGDVGEAFKKKSNTESAENDEDATDPKDIEIVELKKELEELRDKYVRLYADFDNQRKRNAKDKLELIQTAGKDVISQLLPVIDDFERAQKALKDTSDVNAVKEGLQLVYQKLVKNLEAKGLKPMETIGKEFNADMHEAITEVPVPGMEGKVIDEVEKGYYLNDKIIRFAKVVVGKKSE